MTALFREIEGEGTRRLIETCHGARTVAQQWFGGCWISDSRESVERAYIMSEVLVKLVLRLTYQEGSWFWVVISDRKATSDV